jgi:phospholipid/cholesterol/gamma-HCH transport system permease protein
MKARVLGSVQWLGARTLGSFRFLAEVFSLLYGALAVIAYVRTRGTRVVFEVSMTQTLFTGVHAIPLVSLASLALGTLIITQANAYLPTEYKASAAAVIISKDLIPLVVAIIILGRSGTAISVELANMKLSGELDAIRDMGIPLEHYIVLPRLIAGMVSCLVLTVYGIAIAIGAGYALSKVVETTLPYALEALVASIDRHSVVEALVKAAIFGAGIALVSIREGLSVQVSRREIPQATTRAVVYCMALILVLNTVISISF